MPRCRRVRASPNIVSPCRIDIAVRSVADEQPADIVGVNQMADAIVPAGKYMIDPYLDWTKREGVPIHEGFGLDLLGVTTKPWRRFGVNGAIVHVKGRGDAMTVFLLDLPPGAQTLPQKHIFEAAFYVLTGNGSTIVDCRDGERRQF